MTTKRIIKPRNLAAKALRTPECRVRVVRDRTRYTRKGKQAYIDSVLSRHGG